MCEHPLTKCNTVAILFVLYAVRRNKTNKMAMLLHLVKKHSHIDAKYNA